VVYFFLSLLIMAEKQKSGLCDAAGTKTHSLYIGSETSCG
jgi:hypothetical protein